MTVNLEIKGQLAKLLATEDLIIENKKVDTASFNVDTRVLTLPMWEKASNEVYDMLVSHEVGHAIFTPNEDWTVKVPQQFINVVEDARIEKLMKRKYAGLPKTFYRGYKELQDEDFFCIGDEDIPSMNLADRANLWFKVGSFTDIHIERGEEMEIINLIANAETFDDTQHAAEILYKYCKEQQEEQKQEKVSNVETPQQEQGGGKEDSEQEEQQQHSELEAPQSNSGGSIPDVKADETEEDGEEKNDDLKVKTDSSLSEKLKDLISNSVSNVYVESPDLNLDTVVNSNKEVHDVINDHFSFLVNNSSSGIFEGADHQYLKYKKSANSEVNYLVKEFHCKKSADSYSRATTSKTGVLDCSKLHTYKYNEDLFKKVTIIPEGKNHGLVFVLDWSGSMSNVLMDTLKQLYNLIWFCRKVDIPFKVYAFTCEFNIITYDEKHNPQSLKSHYEPKDGLLNVHNRFSLMEFFTSDVSSREIEEQMKNIWRCAYSISKWVAYTIPGRLSLSGTPLNESILVLHKIIPQFKNQHKLQKVNCIILTDGESNHLAYHVQITPPNNSEPYIGVNRLSLNSYLRNRKTRKTYKIPADYKIPAESWGFTDVLIEDLKDEIPEVNFIGIRILDGNSGSFIRRHCGNYGDIHDKAIKQWNKERCVSISSSAYQKYFGISGSALSYETDFYVRDDATKTQVKKAFIKSLKSKKLNKKILGEFVELIA
jgi:hypothetical protein